MKRASKVFLSYIPAYLQLSFCCKGTRNVKAHSLFLVFFSSVSSFNKMVSRKWLWMSGKSNRTQSKANMVLKLLFSVLVSGPFVSQCAWLSMIKILKGAFSLVPWMVKILPLRGTTDFHWLVFQEGVKISRNIYTTNSIYWNLFLCLWPAILVKLSQKWLGINLCLSCTCMY